MYRLRQAPVPVLAASLALLLAGPVSAATPSTELVSVSGAGEQGDGYSDSPSISADGRFVAFWSDATNLVAGDTNGQWDIFVRDHTAGTTERVSVSGAGEQADDWSWSPAISADGRFVAFTSYATNLATGDAHDWSDVFVRDRTSGTTERVSVSSAGEQGNDLSGFASISAGGRFVAFLSYASDLVAGDTNRRADIFVRDRRHGTTQRVSVSSAGKQGNGDSGSPSISADGRFVAFHSGASNLAAADTNGRTDVFVHDRRSGTTRRVSLSSAGKQAKGSSHDPSISADGRFVAFVSGASNLVAHDTNDADDIFVHDRERGTTTRVSVSSAGRQGNHRSTAASISADGRFVAFASGASTLIADDTNGTADIFVRDRRNGTTRRVSVSDAGHQANRSSSHPAASADGRFIAFRSYATNLVADDTNDLADVFVHGPLR